MNFGIKSSELPVTNMADKEHHLIMKGLAHASWMLHLRYQKAGRKLKIWQNDQIELVAPDPEAMRRKFLEFDLN